ncbi:hypothetical protein [Micromonospora sp. WMMD998]|uniref:hypothetical protein n=1 Tax=Micromonospora sp. WMMD998 TaxID=3016092 RepID=UPI00249B1B8E|nr:hypothetical protein [Micromonospora sp. WMMD998]WFE39489.1 hypothetical protein O7619_14075 [Micromonospora sp. WMMD998]
MIGSRAVAGRLPADAGAGVAVVGAGMARRDPGARSRRRRELVGGLLRCYPVSFLVLAPYVVFILPTAVLNGNPHTGLIVLLVGLALLGSASVETIGLLFGRPDPQWRQGMRQATARYPRIYPVARLVTLTGIAANVVGAHLGRGTVVSQVSGELSDTPLAMACALFSGWGILGFALLVGSQLGGRLSSRKLYCWVVVLVGAEAYVAVLTARSAPLIALVFFVAAAGAVSGVFRLRHLLLWTVVLLLAWPAMFAQRNTIRDAQGVAVDTQVTAADRLRLDSQLTAVAGYDVPVEIGQPGVADYVRYGIVPRVLDPERPALSTGQRINQFLGGGPTSSYSFLLLGNIWFFDGPVGVVAVHGFWAGFVALLMRWRGRPGPARLSLFCLVFSDVLLWSGTYPDSTIGFLQHVVSAAPVLLLLGSTRSAPARRDDHLSLPVGAAR